MLLLEHVQLVLRFILFSLHQVDFVEVDGVFIEVPVRRVIPSANLMLFEFRPLFIIDDCIHLIPVQAPPVITLLSLRDCVRHLTTRYRATLTKLGLGQQP